MSVRAKVALANDLQFTAHSQGDAAVDAMVVIDDGGVIQTVNPAAADTLTVARET